jgi:hypothetical protein
MVPEKVADHRVGIFSSSLFKRAREGYRNRARAHDFTTTKPKIDLYLDCLVIAPEMEHDATTCSTGGLPRAHIQLAITFHCVIESALFVTSLRGETTVRTVWTEHDAIACTLV